MSRFAQLQSKKLCKSKSPILIRKARAFLVKILVMLTIPVVLVVRALHPLMLIRFGQLSSVRIGHFAANTEVYLCEREAGMHGRRILDIFYHTTPICNHQLKKMWNRTLHVTRIASILSMANRCLSGGKKHVVPWRKNEDRDIYGLLARTKAHLSFTAEEEHQGREALEQMGVPEGSSFICFHLRDSAYLDAITQHNWDYHNYRDSSIQNYIPAAEELASRDYYLIRMGIIVKEALAIKNSRIIDYAINDRTEFLDIFLGAKCRFFISSATGLSAIPMIFRKPIAWVNFIPLEYAPTWSPNDLFIPKKLWWREEHRFLTLREILDSGIGRFIRYERYEQQGLEVIENTPDEIISLVVEMDERLKGKWQTTNEDKELQRRFWALFKPSELNQVFLSRIGAEFLRQNRELLE